MRKTQRLKELINAKEILVMPGAYDAISAILIERAGFLALQCSGYGIAASILGKPDVGILTMSEMLEQTRNICASVDIPVMADGDTGFGNVINVFNTIERFEAAGVAGINLEDQVFPKRCGHMEGKEVVTREEMVQKIRAARAAAKDPDFIINARTDSIAIYGVEEAIIRGNLYAQAGADLIFVEAPPCEEDIKRIIREIHIPVSINMTEGGKTPMIPFKKLEEWGVARVSVPVTVLFAACKGMENALRVLHDEEVVPSVNHPEMVVDFRHFVELIGLSKIEEIRNIFKPNDKWEGMVK